MGRKGSWLSSIKKTLSPISKEKKIQKSERRAFVEENPSVPDASIVENAGGSYDPPPEDVIPIEVEAEPPITADTTAAAATSSRYAGKSREEAAAIRIQTAFRGYLARRALWALRGLVRLKTVVEGPGVNRQTANTLKCTQNANHLQSQINSRRIRMSENQALQRQILRAKELANLQNGDDWNDSVQSKEEMEAKLLSRYEATMRRERAMAYSFSHQQPWKKSAATTNMLFMDPTNPQWGWSWSERYMAGRPAEAQGGEKDPGNNAKSGINITGTEIAKSYARHQLNSAPSTPRSKSGGGPVASRKPKPGPSPSPRVPITEANEDDDSKSVVSVQSEKNRRHSVGGLAGSPAAGKRMVAGSGKSGKGKSRVQGLSENGGGRMTVGAKKELSFSGSPAKPRRHSGPPKVETAVE
ncbi:protein IQ-DOMAIN 2 [Lactuca sativa]|uniref:DUF4005 domain-containing protein n=1 Tax=Lactuca sativa TaxID=4236 RepID=A0A9R1V7R7_LACSA|nr:protein IQ-DOMAIN 2 [Lactuca sativa]XP_023744892.1 protein IQ-DOMAIN 2 [Lactuca sativa]XP_023744893.1 protein IQ-DOMAIN 2 [Lactuca sativa]KAJ0200459.1 hypothetical protein LSAT_V11C600310570 [Lactuca sativa]